MQIKKLNTIRITIILLLLTQLLSLYSFSTYKQTLLLYLFLTLIGLSFYQLIIPNFMEPRKYFYIFSPLLGLLILVVFGSYLIAYNLPPKFLLVLPFVSILLIAFIGRKSSANEIFKSFKLILSKESRLREILLFLTFIVMPLILLLTYPVGLFNPSTPFRVGPDAALYSYMAQYLLDGGTWLKANLRTSDYSGMDVGLITKFSNNTMDWPFLYFYRWGLVTLQICNTLINGMDHAFRSSFSSMLLPYFFLVGLIFYWLKEIFKISSFISIIGAVGFGFNVNIINLWFEGFYGNIFSLCLYCFLYLIIVLYLSKKELDGNDSIKFFILTSLLFSAILVSYGEGLLFVLPCIIFLKLITDAVIYRYLNYKLYFYLAFSLFIGIIIVLPCKFLLDWLVISLKQVFQEGGNGYPQPYWASINEILGFNNIYKNFSIENAGLLIQRTLFNKFIYILSSVFIIFILFRSYIYHKDKENITIYLISYLLLIIFGILSYFKNPNNNYGFMKMYIFLLPILFVYFWYAIDRFFQNHKDKFISSIMVIFLLNGLSYIYSYSISSYIVEEKYISEHRHMKALNLKESVILPMVSTNYPFFLPSILSGVYFTSGWNRISLDEFPQYSKYLDKKILLLIEKNKLLDYKFNPERVIYEGTSLIIIDSGFYVVDTLDKNQINFYKIDFDDVIYKLNIKNNSKLEN